MTLFVTKRLYHNFPCENGTRKSLDPRAMSVGVFTLLAYRIGECCNIFWTNSL